MNWEREKEYWPHSKLSQFINCYPHDWHIQDTNIHQNTPSRLPTLLLIHGAGASTHSWRLLLSKLESKFRVILVDLPGHGFTKLGTKSRGISRGQTSSYAGISDETISQLNDQKLFWKLVCEADKRKDFDNSSSAYSSYM